MVHFKYKSFRHYIPIIFLASLMLGNTFVLLDRIVAAERQLHVRPQDPKDTVVYPGYLPNYPGVWIRNSTEWRELSSNEIQQIKAENKAERAKVKKEHQKWSKLIEAELAKLRREEDPMRGADIVSRYSPALQPDRTRAAQALTARGMKRPPPYPVLLMGDDFVAGLKPPELPGQAKHTLEESVTGRWSWSTVPDDGVLSRTNRWIKGLSFGPIKPDINLADITTVRTAITLNILTFLLKSVVLLVPGVYLIRKHKNWVKTRKLTFPGLTSVATRMIKNHRGEHDR